MIVVAALWFGICLTFFIMGAVAPLWRITEKEDSDA